MRAKTYRYFKRDNGPGAPISLYKKCNRYERLRFVGDGNRWLRSYYTLGTQVRLTEITRWEAIELFPDYKNIIK